MLSTPTPPIEETFPNEVIRMFLSHLSLRQLLGVMRVNPLWGLLGRSLLNPFLKEEYPFLDAENLNTSECLVLFKNQQAIYAKLAKEYDLKPEDLCRERLEAFYADKDKANFTSKQKAFLTTLAIASGMGGESEDKGEAD